MTNQTPSFETIVLGAGVAGIYQIKCLIDLGIKAIVLEADEGLGGTWYRNRYPGARFDSESYTYGYTFSKEVLDEWHWKEKFSSQPENLKYLNFVANKFDLKRHIHFNQRVKSMQWDESQRLWTIFTHQNEQYTCRFVITAVGALSVPTMPKYQGMDDFKGKAFHSYNWPKQALPLQDCKVGVIGTGATGIQIIAEIADKVKHLTVFQRRPNWSVPLNNATIDEAQMADIRSRYDEIFTHCSLTHGGFEHLPDKRNMWDTTEQERIDHWDDLYDRPGFAMLSANFPETFFDPAANKQLSDYIAKRTRQRINDPITAEKLIPTDHGFGAQRLPLETNYFEVYNRDNVELVDIAAAPIQGITPSGIQTADQHHDLDVIVYATGFHAITGALDNIDICGVNGIKLQQKWQNNLATYLGLLSHNFPNMLMIAGPQSVSGSSNYPRAIEAGVKWATELLKHAMAQNASRIEPQLKAEQEWTNEVVQTQDRMPFKHNKSWFTGYNSNLTGHEAGTVKYHAYWGGAPKYQAFLDQAAKQQFKYIDFD